MTSPFAIITLLLFVEGSMGHALPQLPQGLQGPQVGVVGGHLVEIQDVPFMAALLVADSSMNMTFFKCGASIIHEQFVLTAAHCLFFRSDPLIVRVGTSRPSEEGEQYEQYEVEKYIMHESFNGEYEEAGYDVGLLKLSKPFTFGPSVAVIKLADDSVDTPTGLHANVTGWGYNEDVSNWKKELYQVSVRVSPPADCNYDYFGSPIHISDELQICVKNIHRGFCSGDSGGPLTVAGAGAGAGAGEGQVQVGIVSGGSACEGFSNVYVRVAPHLRWIKHNIQQNLSL